MGAITGLLGVGGGAGGSGYSAPTSANILQPTSLAQTTSAYGQTQGGLSQQQAFLQALQAQNGTQNQSNVFNQLQGVANGSGPNPAQAQLAQATGQNVANQAALMAGQRGSSANVGLIARQAGQQGAATQQAAAGQAATLQANQSMNALNSMGSLATAQVGQQQAALNAYNQSALQQQSNLLNSVQGYNNANVAMQGNVNSTNAALAGGLQAGQANLIGNMAGALGSAAGNLFGGSGAMAGSGTLADTESGTALGSVIGSGGTAAESAGLAGGAGGALADIGPDLALAAKGGQIGKDVPMSKMAKGGDVSSTQINPLQATTPIPAVSSGPQSNTGKMLSSVSTQGPMMMPAVSAKGAAPATNVSPQAEGGQISSKPDPKKQHKLVDALLSPGERYLNPREAQAVKKDGKDPMKAGKKVPGEAKVKGAVNSYANDTVPAKLEKGGIVIPRSITQGKHPGFAAKKFVEAHLAQGGLVKKPKK